MMKNNVELYANIEEEKAKKELQLFKSEENLRVGV